MTSNNNTLKSGTPTKKKTLAGIRKERQQVEAKKKVQERKDGQAIRKKYKNKKKITRGGNTL